MVLEEVIMIAALPLLVGWVLWLLFKRHQLQTQVRLRRHETMNRLIDRFATAKEFVDFLETDTGRRLLEDPLGSPLPVGARALRFLAGGLLLVAVGVAFFLNARRYGGMTDINYINEAIGLNNWGTIFAGCGIALLILALLSYVMGRRSA